MSRTVLVALAVPLLLAAAPRSRPRNSDVPDGRWRVEFANGVVETCRVRTDETAAVSEPLRASPGQWKLVGRAVVITFADDRVERWTKDGDRGRVEHWYPAAAYPARPPVVGTARREGSGLPGYATAAHPRSLAYPGSAIVGPGSATAPLAPLAPP